MYEKRTENSRSLREGTRFCLAHNWLVLTTEDRQWINEQLQRLQTTLLNTVHEPVGEQLEQVEQKTESLADRVKKLGDR
jgi:hypothetical protein